MVSDAAAVTTVGVVSAEALTDCAVTAATAAPFHGGWPRMAVKRY
jgi:hypothetical protein